MSKELHFYFDYSSPFSYLASTQVERVAKDHGAKLVWKPFLLGALFKKIGTPLVPIAAMSEPKRAYIMRDLERWAAHWGVPLRYATGFPLRTVKALRLTLLADAKDVPALVHRLYRLCWQDDGDPEGNDTLLRCARDAGVPEALVHATSGDEARAKLLHATDEAVKLGVPGAPTFIVDESLFWGQDRLHFVERALDGWKPRFP